VKSFLPFSTSPITTVIEKEVKRKRKWKRKGGEANCAQKKKGAKDRTQEF
jgi:hypothetical protein